MDQNPHTRDRLVNCILAGAVGDALGGAYEGTAFPGPIDFDSMGHVSDDTQLTLATCEAIGEGGSVTPEAVAARFVAWFREGRLTGLGASTLKALRDLDAGAHWASSGRRGEMAAGNGAAMRIAPLAFVLDPDLPEERTLLRDICWITHQSDEAYVGALAICRAIRRMASGSWAPGENLVAAVAKGLPDTNVRDRLEATAELPQELSLEQHSPPLKSSGYVADSVPLAILASQRIGQVDFESVLTEILSIGGDTDTNASMACQILGAWSGWSGTPEDLIACLPEAPLVLGTVRELAARIFPGG